MRYIAPLLVVLLLIAALFTPHKTGPTEVGVRTIKWSPFAKSGVEDHVYPPGGIYFFPAVINGWTTLDTRLFNIEMTYTSDRGDKPFRDDLLFKTIDGNDISLDVIVSYRIDPAKAWWIVQYVGSSDFEVKDKLVRTIARSRPRDIFGELKTEEFYIADKRDLKAENAKQVLNQVLGPYGIIVERVATKDYRFNPAYQRAIEDKKVADQVAEQNKSATKATQEEYLKRLEEAKGEVNKMVAAADGSYQQAKIEADAYFLKQQRLAQAIEAEGQAEAKGITEMNKALAGSGGEVMVKMKLAESLAGKPILVLPLSGSGFDLKTTDVNQLLSTYGVRSIAKPKPSPAAK